LNKNSIIFCGKVMLRAKEVPKFLGSKVCFPKQEGGLGLKRIEEWNKAAVLKHIWHLFTQAGSLWVAWVHDELLKGSSFWTVKVPQSCSWGWRNF
jgi:hypothetical protein